MLQFAISVFPFRIMSLVPEHFPCRVARCVDHDNYLQGDFRTHREGYLSYRITWFEGDDAHYQTYYNEQPYWGFPQKPLEALPLVDLPAAKVRKLKHRLCREKVLNQRIHTFWKPKREPELPRVPARTFHIEDSPGSPPIVQLPATVPAQIPAVPEDLQQPSITQPEPLRLSFPLLPFAEPICISDDDESDADMASTSSVATTEIDNDEDTQTIEIDSNSVDPTEIVGDTQRMQIDDSIAIIPDCD